MGKNLIQQKRGRGTPTYRSRSFRFRGTPQYALPRVGMGTIKDIFKCPGHTTPLMQVKFEDKEEWLLIAPEGIHVGQQLSVGGVGEEVKPGEIRELEAFPLGTLIYNIECRPGDGGRFVRASGTFAKIIAKTDKGVEVKLPSKTIKIFNSKCRASMGRAAGSGRTEKPFVKAGKRHHKIRAVGGLYPFTSGVSMNAVNHPYGGSSSHSKGRPTIAPKNAPPGRKVGKLRPSRTGKR